jgi:hypothetical protein
MRTCRKTIWMTRNPSSAAVRALTTAELMITMAVFGLVVIGLIELHIFGLRQNQVVESKLGASDQARTAFSYMVDDIRRAKMWRIGNGAEDSFTSVTNGTPQVGSALQLYPGTDTNGFIRYYFDANAGELWRTWTPSGTPGEPRLVAGHLTNSFTFRAEDFLGNLKTNLSYKAVIRVVLEFSQYDEPETHVGEGYLFDSYKLEFKVAPHSPDGA